MKPIKRFFPPGSEWLYFKIYSGEATCDKLLTDLILPFSKFCQRKGWTSQWFFIRYHDTSFHLRIRYRMRDTIHVGELIRALYKRTNRLIQDSIIHKICIDTYTREIERYSHFNMEVSETIFCIDSICICEILKEIKLQNILDRAFISFILIDSFLDVFRLSTTAKLELISKIDSSYMSEFGFDRHNMKQLNNRYRIMRHDIANAIEHEGIELDRIRLHIDQRNRKLDNLQLHEYENLSIPSFLHMMINRFFASNNRLNEMVIYNYLTRYYKSVIARGK